MKNSLQSVSAPFYSLVQAMVEKNVVAIVEKVYRKNTEANMMALFPSVDDPNEPWVSTICSLVLLRLFYYLDSVMGDIFDTVPY